MTPTSGRAPAARVDVVRETLFGRTLDDPYRWMEDPSDPDLRPWLMAQAEHCRSALEGMAEREPLLDRIAELSGAAPTLTALALAGDRVFHLRDEGGAGVPWLAVREADGAERVLLDPNLMAGGEHSSIDWYVPSPRGRYVAVAVSQGGSENATLRVVDVDRGTLIEDAITRVSDGFLAWLDDESFGYHRHRDLPAGTPANERRLDSSSYLHRLGEDPARDVRVLGPRLNPRLAIGGPDLPYLVAPPGRDWIVALVAHSALGEWATEQIAECSIYVAPRAGLADPGSCAWTLVAGPDDGVTAFTSDAETLYLVSYRGAPRSQVLAVPFADPDLARARVVVPGGERAIDAVAVAGDHLLVRDLDGGVTRLRRVPLRDGAAAAPVEITLPEEGTVREWAALPHRPEALLIFTSWTRSPGVYRLDPAAGTVTDTGWLAPSPVDFGGVVATTLQVPARDGTLIPMSVVHRRGLVLDGNNPTMMGAGGAYGYTIRPWFQPEMLAWYERDGIFAIARVRGGGEYGREWHAAGLGPKKENTIGDFIDCAEYLIARGYTRPGRLAADGGSAGAIPAAGAMVRRPDLLAAVVLRVPVLNALRIELGEHGPVNIPEFGSHTTEPGLRDLVIIDSYLRVTDGTDYPAVLLVAGLNDTLPVWQAGKMAARLQAATASDRPILLRLDEHAGHGVGSTRRQVDTLLADRLAFLLHAMPPT